MNAQQPATPAASMTADDLYYILFRHKWKIIICTVLGLAAAGAVYQFYAPPYESEATLFIRYVTDSATPGLPDASSRAVSLDQGGATIMNTEVEILKSWDLAGQVADIVTPDKILTHVKGPKDRNAAAVMIQNNLTVEALPQSSVIQLIFKSPDPAVVQPVLSTIIDVYKKMHKEVHLGMGTAGDLLTQETDQLHQRLAQTEDNLRAAENKAGVISPADARKSFAEQEARIQEDIFSANAELAERSAAYDAISKIIAAKQSQQQAAAPAPETPPPTEAVEQYQHVFATLDRLQKAENQLLTQFTDENQWVKDTKAKIVATQAERKKLEDKYPALLRLLAPPSAAQSNAPAPGSTIDLVGEGARLTGLKAKIAMLTDQLATIQKQEANLETQEGAISELQRQKDHDEANYQIISTHQEAERIDDALSSGHALNIFPMSPTPPSIDWKKSAKLIGGLAAGGLLFGLAWAFAIEFYLDRSIRRPSDVERGLRTPLFLSIPDFGRNGHNKNVFHDTLRDRLVGYFESKNLTHKPKLVAVTGVGKHSGVTTTAAGLAHSLSETAEGNVLLVDMTVSQGSAQQYYKGKAVCGLDSMLDSRSTAKVEDKLYVVGEEPSSDKLSRALPRRFNQLVPQLQASDFDYIIFDMPSVNQISITPRLAGFMDMVLLVLESEHTDRDIAQQAVAMLASSRAHVGVVLNKTRNYLPSKAHHDFLGLA